MVAVNGLALIFLGSQVMATLQIDMPNLDMDLAGAAPKQVAGNTVTCRVPTGCTAACPEW